jgi:dihydroneopterin aldolase
MRHAKGLTVVKIGGSHAVADHLKEWLRAMAGCAGHAVVVPGGGPFADTVRLSQPKMGFDDGAAHHMALLAMQQFGCALANLGTGLALADSLTEIRRVVRAGAVPVWSPDRMVLRAADIPWSWDVTSDSLAAWLAGKIGARRVLLVKSSAPATGPLRASDLVERGIVDQAFAGFLASSGATGAIVGPADHAAAADAIRHGELTGAIIRLH